MDEICSEADTRDASTPGSGPEADPYRVVVIVTSAAGSHAVGFDEQNAIVIDLPPPGAGPSRIDAEALRRLVADRWPGSLQELCTVIERALALAAPDGIADELPSHVRPRHPTAPPLASACSLPAPRFEPPLDLRAQLKQREQELIYRALERTNGHQRKAAELLGVPLRTLERKLQKLAKRPARSH